MKPLNKVKVEKACGCGNALACKVLALHGFDLFGASKVTFSDVETEDNDHPNKMPFEGTLLLTDVPSTKPPHGSRGHRILVPTDVARKRLDGLVGMGINYEASLEAHAPRRKVGTITEAWMDGNKVQLKGIIYKKDFPEAERDLKGRKDLGMSMELANVYVRNENETVWHLDDFQFTGATILTKDSAAYHQTSLAATAAAATSKGEVRMAKINKNRATVAAAGEFDYDKLAVAIGKAVKASNVELVQTVTASVEKIGNRIDELAEVTTLQAAAANDEDDDSIVAAAKNDDDDDDDDDDMDAKAHDDEDDSDDEDDDPSDDDDDEDLDAMEDLEEKAPHADPGEVNKGMKTKGRKTTTTDVGAAKVFPNVKAKGISAVAQTVLTQIQARAEKHMKKISAMSAAAIKENKKLRKTVSRLEAQVERYADAEERRSVSSIPRDLTNLAGKANVDLREIQASGTVLNTDQVDQIFAGSGIELDPTQRMAMKNRLLELGLMDQGAINRGFTN